MVIGHVVKTQGVQIKHLPGRDLPQAGAWRADGIPNRHSRLNGVYPFPVSFPNAVNVLASPNLRTTAAPRHCGGEILRPGCGRLTAGNGRRDLGRCRRPAWRGLAADDGCTPMIGEPLLRDLSLSNTSKTPLPTADQLAI